MKLNDQKSILPLSSAQEKGCGKLPPKIRDRDGMLIGPQLPQLKGGLEVSISQCLLLRICDSSF